MSSMFGGRFRERSSPTPFKAGTVIGKRWRAKFDAPLKDLNDKFGPLQTYVKLTGDFLKKERCWDQINPGPPYRGGGPFTDIKVDNQMYNVQGVGTYFSRSAQAGTGEMYVGGWSNPTFAGDDISFATYANLGIVPSGLLTSIIPEIEGLGPEAYRRMRPQLEIAGMGQFLGEARDLPRMLKTTAQGFSNSWKALFGNSGRSLSPEMPKKVADQFINSQFGWVPFVNDLKKFDDVVHNSQKYVDRISRMNGQWDKRFTVLSNTETQEVLLDEGGMGVWPIGTQIGFMFSLGSDGLQALPWMNTSLEETQKIWSSGWFKYYRPEFDSHLSGYNSAWGAAQRQLMLYGARINPSVLYKITPWSWLADWFTNLGTNIDNANSRGLDGSVSRNLFLMAHSHRRIRFQQFLPLRSGPQRMTWLRNVDAKMRRIGGPYGLGWSSSSLTARQTAILLALGISRT